MSRIWLLVAALAICLPASVEAECTHVVLYHCCQDSAGNPTGDEHGPPTCDLWLAYGVQGVAHEPRLTTEHLGD